MKHPAAQDALRYITSRPLYVTNEWIRLLADSDDPVSNVCCLTLSNIIEGKDVYDIDILGLAYVMKQGECG